MSYTMEDFRRDVVKKEIQKLTAEDQREVIRSLPPGRRREVLESLSLEKQLASLTPQKRRTLLAALPLEERLEGVSVEQIRQYLEQHNAGRRAAPRKSRRKKER